MVASEPSILVVEDVAETRCWLCDIALAVYPRSRIAAVESLCGARELLTSDSFQLALIDIHLPDGSGIDLVREIVARGSGTDCVITTAYSDDDYLFEALRAGAQGYLLKEQTQEQLIRHLRGMAQGQPPLSPRIARRVLQSFRPAEDGSLTPREIQVLALIAKGMTLKAVAGELGVSHHTAGDHVKHIYRKLHVRNRAEAALEAAQRGLVGPAK